MGLKVGDFRGIDRAPTRVRSGALPCRPSPVWPPEGIRGSLGPAVCGSARGYLAVVAVPPRLWRRPRAELGGAPRCRGPMSLKPNHVVLRPQCPPRGVRRARALQRTACVASVGLLLLAGLMPWFTSADRVQFGSAGRKVDLACIGWLGVELVARRRPRGGRGVL